MFTIRMQLGLRLLFLSLRILPNDWARTLMQRRVAEMIAEVRQRSFERRAQLDAEIEQLKR
jgi:hypothetical protein